MNEATLEQRVLLVRTQAYLCALRVGDVIETLRSLPIVSFSFGPPFLRGVSVVRGIPVPVVDLAILLGRGGADAGHRFVSMRCGARRFCLLVDDVVGVVGMDRMQLEKASPLVSGMVADYVERLGVLDGEVLVALETARLIPEQVWHSVTELDLQ